MSERVVKFGDTRYEHTDGVWWGHQGGTLWDVTPQEGALVEELERQQKGIRHLLAERDELRVVVDRCEATIDEISRLAADEGVSDEFLRGFILGTEP